MHLKLQKFLINYPIIGDIFLLTGLSLIILCLIKIRREENPRTYMILNIINAALYFIYILMKGAIQGCP